MILWNSFGSFLDIFCIYLQDISSCIQLNYLSNSDIKDQNQIKVIESLCNGNSCENLDGKYNEESKFGNEQKTSDSQVMVSNIDVADKEEMFPAQYNKRRTKIGCNKNKTF